MTDGIYVAVKLNTFPRVIILYLEKIILPVTASFPQKRWTANNRYMYCGLISQLSKR